MVSLTLFFLLNIHPFFIIYSFFIFHQSIGTGPFEKFCLHTEFPSRQTKYCLLKTAKRKRQQGKKWIFYAAS